MDFQNTLKTLQEKKIAAEKELENIESTILVLEKNYFQEIAREVPGWKRLKKLKYLEVDEKRLNKKKKKLVI